MFLAIARKLNLEKFRDIPLRSCGTSRYSTEIAEAFITVHILENFSTKTFFLMYKKELAHKRNKCVMSKASKWPKYKP